MSGTHLCNEHLAQIDEVKETIGEISREASDSDPYSLLVCEYTQKISRSEQMFNLTEAIFQNGVRNAPQAFPDLFVLPGELMDQLAAFLAVSVVSAVIQERAHLLARAKMLADYLPTEKASGIFYLINDELESLGSKKEEINSQ
jgi:hypothetical protein